MSRDKQKLVVVALCVEFDIIVLLDCIFSNVCISKLTFHQVCRTLHPFITELGIFLIHLGFGLVEGASYAHGRTEGLNSCDFEDLLHAGAATRVVNLVKIKLF